MDNTFRPADPPAASSITIIHPHPNTHGQVVKLSVIDQIAPRDYISTCLFFPLVTSTDKTRIFHAFERALYNTVNDIPELACCVQKHTGNDREEVELLFHSDKGAEIHYKDYTSPGLRTLWKFGTFEQLEQDHFPLQKLPRHIVFGTSSKLVQNVRLSALVVQCNFIRGGLILGTCLHHVAGDGICNLILHKTIGLHFAAIVSGLSIYACPITTMDRSRTIQGNRHATLEELPDWKLTEDSAGFLNPVAYESVKLDKFEYAIFYISAEKMSLLKRFVLNSTPEVKFSTTEALGAFLWRHVVLAREIDPQEYPEAKLSITIDARGRTNPSTPSNYWGNFSEPNAVAKLPVALLQRQPSSGGHEGGIYLEPVRCIKKAIAAIDDKAVRRLVGLLNQMPKSTTLTWNVNRYPGPDMLIVCLQAHRYNDISFGPELGYPSAMRVTVGDTECKPDGRCIILPPRRADGQGLEIVLQYGGGMLKRLVDNSEFSNFFIRRN
ncbi:trichothecene 3-O-acetyltransferase [Fusarium albosuccineum]|uniref:Trichothecene 3-O-acetyltransferase n=1 Tax=Fusarium albosuccineum TaxID=1237068 RepID=A0A8H4PJU9_9HYPO|nr:trichothecene 3-O-acetyltransferase [Fusarium albosuccineum]